MMPLSDVGTRITGRWFASMLCVMTSAGCLGPAYRNAPLKFPQPGGGYRFDNLTGDASNSDEVFVCLTFSGGGTRAAAMAYGVLQTLRDTPLTPSSPDGRSRTLLDEVDVISAVSGGSVTAMAYGLWRERVFDGRFERAFLRRDVEMALIGHVLSPRNLFLLPFVALDTVDVCADFFDRRIYADARYSDLMRLGDRPFIVINATNVALGQRFEFTQEDFDVLGSDLSGWPAGYAVAASAAYPLVFSPMRLRYYPSPAGTSHLGDILCAPDASQCDARRVAWASSLVRSTDPNAPDYGLDERHHRYLYLLDGGLADHLGLMHVIHEYQHGYIRRRIENGSIRKLLIIIVDAGARPRERIERREASPGLLTVGYKTAVTGIDNHSSAMVQMLRLLVQSEAALAKAFEDCREAIRTACPDAKVPPRQHGDGVEAFVVHLNFADLDSPVEAEWCQNIPTRLCLPKSDVDRLIRAGRSLLTRNREFQRFLATSNP